MSSNTLSPAAVFAQFAKINTIPRPSKHEDQIMQYIVAFGKKRGLPTFVDEVGNVLIRKAATPGYEDRPCITIQSHMDMVCDKLVDKDFNFATDAIEAYVDGEWMKAHGTTLGADDGIGCAIELALLDSDDIEHGPIECLFTRDEETGLTGAEGMKGDFISGARLINLDSEDEGQIFVACAGGRNTTATFHYTVEAAPADSTFLALQLKGFCGGHSGDDINKKHANAIKIMARFLYQESKKMELRLAEWHSGKLHNAIPRDGRVVVAVPQADKATLKEDWETFANTVRNEYHVTEKTTVWISEDCPAQPVLPQKVGESIIRALQALDNGVYAMCQEEDIAWLVETSSNVASIHSDESTTVVLSSQRSSVMSALDNICATVRATFELAGAEVAHADGYPAWPRKAHSALAQIATETYKELFNKEPLVLAVHAGLECALFAQRYPDLDMISFGPTLRNVHTPDEMLHIPTVQMVWDHLLAILKR